jgi:hypothetical protein
MFVGLVVSLGISWSQEKEYNGYRPTDQFYLEDSTRVFWTSYPNPFSPPTVLDSTKGMLCGGLTFFCNLSDTVEVALIGECDSILCVAKFVSNTPPWFSICWWRAGPRLERNQLPKTYFRGNADTKLGILLLIDGRRKNFRRDVIHVSNGWYCWLEDSIKE